MACLRRLHRWISLTCLLFWAIQAASGIFLVFHREVDDWMLPTRDDRPLDLSRLGERIEALEVERNAVANAIFSSTGYSDRFDIHLEDRTTGSATIVRVDGQGGMLRERAFEAPLLNGGIYLVANRLHRQLLAGMAGGWLVAMSGMLLLSNLLLGLKLAWPARSRWRKALLPSRKRSAAAMLYGWHRALGLGVAPLALVTLGCGTLLAFEGGLARLIGAESDRPPASSAGATGTVIPAAEAVEAALRRYPEATFTGMRMPSQGWPLYSIFLRQPAELDQAYGATRLFVDAGSGRIVGGFDPLRAKAADRFMSALIPLHTGQIGGWAGRGAVLEIGIWLIGMGALGSALWWLRRRQTARRNAQSVSMGGRHAPQDVC